MKRYTIKLDFMCDKTAWVLVPTFIMCTDNYNRGIWFSWTCFAVGLKFTQESDF